MNKQQPPPLQEMAAQLRDEAPTVSYSPFLHERIMQSIRAEAAQPRTTPAPHRSNHLIQWTAAAAAAILVFAGINTWQSQRHPAIVPPVNLSAANMPAVDTLVADVASNAGASLHAEIGNFQLAYLDEDARHFGTFVIDSLQVVPPPPASTPQ